MAKDTARLSTARGTSSATWDGKRVVLIAHSANRWALQTLLDGTPLAEAVVAPFEWQEGWSYTLPSGWSGD